MSYEINHHSFTDKILAILKQHFPESYQKVFKASPLLGYLNIKTKSANSGAKARGSFANHYALYVIIEDYIQKGFLESDSQYSKYEGARFSDLFKRQRELPFGAKLQNHALNHRLNEEFKKYYPLLDKPIIIRDVDTQRYWIQEDFLIVPVRQNNGSYCNIAKAVIDIIDTYVATKKAAFENFLETCQKISELGKTNPSEAIDFVIELLKPSVDARIFEIVSYAILKTKYGQETIWLGKEKETVTEENLILYKTGRTNANDGGIDFVMRPLGRFFK